MVINESRYLMIQKFLFRQEFSRIVASLLTAFAGILLYMDKIFLQLELGANYETYGFENFETFIWVMTQSLTPLIIIFCYPLKPYYLSFTIPIYCYAIQMIWIFQPELTTDDIYLQSYAIGSCLLFVLLVILMKRINSWRRKQLLIENEFQSRALDLMQNLKEEKSANERFS